MTSSTPQLWIWRKCAGVRQFTRKKYFIITVQSVQCMYELHNTVYTSNICMYCPYNTNVMFSTDWSINKEGACTYFGLKRAPAAILNSTNVLKKKVFLHALVSAPCSQLHFECNTTIWTLIHHHNCRCVSSGQEHRSRDPVVEHVWNVMAHVAKPDLVF